MLEAAQGPIHAPRSWRRPLSVALVAAAMAAPLAAQTGLEIMKEQSRRHQAKSEEARSKITLVDPSGKEKQRELIVISRRGDDGLSKIVLKFLAPADIRNTGLLTWEQAGDKDDDQWLFLPATKAVNRIASSSKKGAFMNTDLAYEDLRPENLESHTYNVLREEDLGGQRCWVIEAVPSTDKEKMESGYAKRVFWVRKDLHLTVQTEFYNRSDKLFKRAAFSDFANVGGELWRAKTVRVETLDRKTATVLTTVEQKVNQTVDENLFTQQGLMRPL
jgi:outer membrane lipoprotein-sorting protein